MNLSFFEKWVQESKRTAVEPGGFDLYISAPKYSCTMRSYFNKHSRKVFEVDSISVAEPKTHIRKSFDTKRRAKKYMNYQLGLLVWTKYENHLISSVDCPDEVPAGADDVDVEIGLRINALTTFTSLTLLGWSQASSRISWQSELNLTRQL